MKKDFIDDAFLVSLIPGAVAGDKAKQRAIFDIFKIKTAPINIKYKVRCNKLGIDKEELSGICDEAYLITLNKYDADKGKLVSFFLSIYENLIISEIQKRMGRTYLMNINSTSYGCEDIEELVDDDAYYSDSKQNIDNTDLIKVLLNNPKVGLNSLEKTILLLYCSGNTLKEISDDLHISYSIISTAYRTLQKKIKKYIERALPDIFYSRSHLNDENS